MNTIHMLLGFNAKNTQSRIRTEISSNGFDVKYIECVTKPAIQEYLWKNADCNTVILKEYLDDGSFFTAEELAALNDDIDRNIIVILQGKRRGTEFMQILYQSGITGAVFEDNRVGVIPEKLAHLACNRRSRKDARTYYGIQQKKFDVGSLTYADYIDYYQYLMDESKGLDGTDRFLTIMRCLSPRQAADFIKKLPQEVLDILTLCSEFYDVTDELQRLGVGNLKYRRPKKLNSDERNLKFADRVRTQMKNQKEISIRPPEQSQSVKQEAITSQILTEKEVIPPLLSGKSILNGKKSVFAKKEKEIPVTYSAEETSPVEIAKEDSDIGKNTHIEDSTVNIDSFAHFFDMDILKNIPASEFIAFLKEQQRKKEKGKELQGAPTSLGEEFSHEEKILEKSSSAINEKEPEEKKKDKHINITEEMKKAFQGKKVEEKIEEEKSLEDDVFHMFHRFTQ